MPTQEERINTLEKTVALLQKKFNDADIQSVNHNSAMLLGLVYKQQSDIREIKTTLSEHTEILSEHTTVLTKHTSKLENIEQHIQQLEVKSDKHTELLNENTKLLTQLVVLLTKPSNG